MLGTNEKPEGYGVTFALNPWFKGYRLQRHLGDPFISSICKQFVYDAKRAADFITPADQV